MSDLMQQLGRDCTKITCLVSDSVRNIIPAELLLLVYQVEPVQLL